MYFLEADKISSKGRCVDNLKNPAERSKSLENFVKRENISFL